MPFDVDAMSAEAGPRRAALLAAAAEPVPDIPFVSFESEGVVLIYGCDAQAIEAGNLLKDDLDVTVLITPGTQMPSSAETDYPVAQGTVRSVQGHFGAFELVVDDYRPPASSSAQLAAFATARDGARSRCDLILDLSGGAALFTAPDLHDGYLRADPGNPAAVRRAALEACDLVGSFDKPRYIAFAPELCAHARAQRVGCRRCLDLCPAGAIAPAGDHVAIDAHVCAGCGQCAAACPTGAAAYSLPPADILLRKLRALLAAYAKAGGAGAVVLIHDAAHGRPLIEALGECDQQLPTNVLPFEVNEVTQVGLEAIAACFAYGACAVRFLLRGKPRHDLSGLMQTLALAECVLTGLGFGPERAGAIETDDPDALAAAVRELRIAEGCPRPSRFLPVGSKREVMRLSLRELHRAAPSPADIVVLPKGAPFGAIDIDVSGCTLCLACVSACPTGALGDNPEQPMLRFTEDACVQCGLCAATCPEKVINLRPQLDFRAATMSARVLKEEQPFHCIRCGKPFGVRSTIERITARLAGKHWMFSNGTRRLDVIKMCEDCRVGAITEEAFDPHAAPSRPAPRTTEDYLRERDDMRRGRIGGGDD
jgi:ferredoxin